MHKQYLIEALGLARKGRGFCAPNPAVASIVVKNNEIIGRGIHRGAGQMHAESQVLQELGERAKGATMYVSLEPCNHWGKTPPCTESIIASGIDTVYFAYYDPNPLVSANDTSQILQRQGIDCHHIYLAEATEFYQSYAHWLKYRRPFVTAKIAQSLDGKIAHTGGRMAAITGADCSAFTHDCRAASDVLMTSSKTLNNDDPQFNVRRQSQIVSKPVAVLDRRLILRRDLQIYQTSESLIVFYDRELPQPQSNEKLRYVPVNVVNQQLRISEVLACLGEMGYHDLWFEGGGESLTSMLEQSYIDKLHIYVAGKTLGCDALDAYTSKLNLLHRQKGLDWQLMGDDVMATVKF